jgi:hypothetical protein
MTVIRSIQCKMQELRGQLNAADATLPNEYRSTMTAQADNTNLAQSQNIKSNLASVKRKQQNDNSSKENVKSLSKKLRASSSSMANQTLVSSSPPTVNNSLCSGVDEMKLTQRVRCTVTENPFYAFGILACLLMALFCIGRWWMKCRNNGKNSNRRYLEMSEYAALATEYDELLEGVFESDEFTQYLDEDDDDGNSIASILTEWSGDHAAELLRDGVSTEIPTTFDIDLDKEYAAISEKQIDRFKIV